MHLQPGAYDLVGYIVYEIDQHPYQNVFYNGTIEVVEAGGLLSVESVFLITLGIALLGLFGLWAYGQVQQLSKVILFFCVLLNFLSLGQFVPLII
jgi:translocon-associated protein subunit alpha